MHLIRYFFIYSGPSFAYCQLVLSKIQLFPSMFLLSALTVLPLLQSFWLAITVFQPCEIHMENMDETSNTMEGDKKFINKVERYNPSDKFLFLYAKHWEVTIINNGKLGLLSEIALETDYRESNYSILVVCFSWCFRHYFPSCPSSVLASVFHFEYFTSHFGSGSESK